MKSLALPLFVAILLSFLNASDTKASDQQVPFASTGGGMTIEENLDSSSRQDEGALNPVDVAARFARIGRQRIEEIANKNNVSVIPDIMRSSQEYLGCLQFRLRKVPMISCRPEIG